MPIRAVTFDAYGTLLRNEDLTVIPRRIVADHGLSVSTDDVLRTWIDLYHEATQLAPFQTLREIEGHILPRVLRQLGIVADASPYVDLFFQVTTKVELYPEALEVLNALGSVLAAIVSNADHEHVAAWTFKWPVQFVLVSEAVQAYKPDPRVFRRALQQLGLQPHEVLHVGDSDIDDVKGAQAAGLRVAWLNRAGRPRRPEVPAPDHEIRDLTELLPLL
ncbi:MAG TPA: HAD family hydrolase [Methylomirabilota bacterium]